MTDDHPADDLQVKAVRYAVEAMGADYAPLTRLQCIVVACVAVNHATLTIDPMLSPAAREAQMAAAAHAALLVEQRAAAVRAEQRRALIGGIERLQYQQQIVLSLRFEHGLKNPEIAAVLGISEHDVRVATAKAFDELWGGPA